MTGATDLDRTGTPLRTSDFKSEASTYSATVACLVSVGRIELPLHAPKARVMPFHYTELFFRNFIPTNVPQNAPMPAGINSQ